MSVPRNLRTALLVPCALTLAACAGMPGRDEPRPSPVALTHPANPALAAPLAAAAREHPDLSGFRIYSLGIDGLLLRLELIAHAQRSLDLQYYIFHGDESGKLVTEALLAAARRGVRVRILVDDGEALPGDEQLFALAGDPNVAIRLFNPWRYRGHSSMLRATEYLFSHSRLDYRMHNKLFIADGVVALIGGRNIGEQYFQVDPDSQYADDDVLVAGPETVALGGAFEEFWNSEEAVPAQLVIPVKQRDAAAAERLSQRHTEPLKAAAADSNFTAKLAADEPLADVLAGSAALSWARAQLAYDPPGKRHEAAAERAGSLMFAPVAKAIRATQGQLRMVTPYLIPTSSELKLLEETAQAPGRQVSILTTSLEASTDPLAQAGYVHYREPLLRAGVQLFELRRQPDSPRGTGQSTHMTGYGNFGLHAKLLVFDDSAIYVGSMNFDARSRRLNTEIGLIIHSQELATETIRRFEAMTQPANAYRVRLEDRDGKKILVWSTVKDGQPVQYLKEPSHSGWQRFEVRTASLLPLDPEL
ncbi:MAG TPA: phospholipase D family protein [Steroidobacteraceae bacterium]|nr:phospholipase D family protein [Steroidobacteraceae bacterium]